MALRAYLIYCSTKTVFSLGDFKDEWEHAHLPTFTVEDQGQYGCGCSSTVQRSNEIILLGNELNVDWLRLYNAVAPEILSAAIGVNFIRSYINMDYTVSHSLKLNL